MQTGRQKIEVFGSQENNSFIKHAFGFFFAPVLNSTSCLHRDLNILCKYEWPSIRWSWSVTDGENFHLHSCVVYSSAVLPPYDLHDLLVGDSQERQNVLPVSTSSCGSSGGNNNHRRISQGTRVQLVSRLHWWLDIHAGNGSKDIILYGFAGHSFDINLWFFILTISYLWSPWTKSLIITLRNLTRYNKSKDIINRDNSTRVLCRN